MNISFARIRNLLLVSKVFFRQPSLS